jgi:7,8-dihydroneopterin aldolase/epimerase/oxygenase
VIEIELHGLELFAYHGVLEEERREGQTFLVDVRLAVPETVLSDRIEDAVDYRLVVDCVREVSDARAFRLLEALAHAIAVELLRRFPAGRVRVRVRKPGVALPVEYAAETVELDGQRQDTRSV